MTPTYQTWADQALAGQSIPREDARRIVAGEGVDLMPLLMAAGQVRFHHFANTVTVHMLENVRNGACPEDCGYCGQSKISDAPIKPYKLKPVDEIVADAEKAKASGAFRYCMALSGRGPGDKEIAHMAEAVRRVKALGLRTCLSAGLMDEQKARVLKDAGLDRFNHNLNTSRGHYPAICSTHTYDDRIETLRTLRNAGVGLCSGLIVGMGERYDDLVDVAYELADVQAESIPVNFLLPIDGNPINDPKCEGQPLDSGLVLRVLSMMRLVNPAAEIRVAAGREQHLRSAQALALWPANSLFIDGYLLTEGDNASATMRMMLDAGFQPLLEEGDWPESVKSMLDAGANAAIDPDAHLPRLKATVSAGAAAN